MMKSNDTILLFALILFVNEFGCGFVHQTSVVTIPYRHPLLENAPQPNPHNRTSFNGVDWLSEDASQPILECNSNYRHPLLNQCLSRYLPLRQSQQFAPIPIYYSDSQKNDKRLSLSFQARSLLMKKNKMTTIEKKEFSDCYQFVIHVYDRVGIPIGQWVKKLNSSSSGVYATYELAKNHGWLHQNKIPQIGDLVFFDNTYDRNRDGKMNDPLTHIGIVERIDSDGTISFIHHVGRGVLRYKMNRFQPDIRRDKKSHKVYNQYLRVVSRKSPNPSQRLTGQLFRAFATVVN